MPAIFFLSSGSPAPRPAPPPPSSMPSPSLPLLALVYTFVSILGRISDKIGLLFLILDGL